MQLQRLVVVAQQRVLPGLLQHQGQLAHGRRHGSRQRRLDVHRLGGRRHGRARRRRCGRCGRRHLLLSVDRFWGLVRSPWWSLRACMHACLLARLCACARPLLLRSAVGGDDGRRTVLPGRLKPPPPIESMPAHFWVEGVRWADPGLRSRTWAAASTGLGTSSAASHRSPTRDLAIRLRTTRAQWTQQRLATDES